jgi:hypothetical protein
VTCVGSAPQSIDALLALVTACATEAGGPGWASLAILGAQTALLLVVVVALAGAVVVRWGRL